MNKTSATKLDLGQYALELADLENAAPASIELPPLAAITIVTLIQFASRHPSVGGDDNLTKTAIDTARQFQELFHWESATYKVLESGWNSDFPDADGGCDSIDEDESDFLTINHEEFYSDTYREHIDTYVGEAPLDRYIDPEEEGSKPYSRPQ